MQWIYEIKVVESNQFTHLHFPHDKCILDNIIWDRNMFQIFGLLLEVWGIYFKGNIKFRTNC